ncbi:hypothetical protein C8R43DRAFT_1116134 [Mycena crocata]|nr:hypothetical protein C8R43DRAFT_1116134 [Mycena crocata]
MKIPTVVLLISLFAVGYSSAARIISPQPGDQLSIAAGFNPKYNTERYFGGEKSKKISVVVSSRATDFPAQR